MKIMRGVFNSFKKVAFNGKSVDLVSEISVLVVIYATTWITFKFKLEK